MRSRLRVYRPVSESDAAGGHKIRYEEKGMIHAERKKISPSFVKELGELFSDITVEFNVRDSHKVEELWRVEELGGYLYTVSNVIPRHDIGMLTLRCERVNQ